MKCSKYLIVICACLFLGVGRAQASVTPNSIVTAQTPRADAVQIVNGSGVVTLNSNANYVTLGAAPTNYSAIKEVTCTSTDTATHNVVIARIRSTTVYPLAVMALSAGSATALGVFASDPMSSTNMWNALDSDGNHIFQMTSADTLAVGVLTTVVTAATAVSCTDTGGDY